MSSTPASRRGPHDDPDLVGQGGQPDLVMGATKLLAENSSPRLRTIVVLARRRSPASASATSWGSRGSALELFAQPDRPRWPGHRDRSRHDPLRDVAPIGPSSSRSGGRGPARAARCSCSRCRSPACPISSRRRSTSSPRCRPRPGRDRDVPMTAGRREALRRADDGGRVDPRARHRRHVRRAAVDRDRPGVRAEPYRRGSLGAGRRPTAPTASRAPRCRRRRP